MSPLALVGRFSPAPFALLPLATYAVELAPPISAIGQTAGGVLEVRFELPATRYAVLQRSGSLDGPWSPVAVVRGNGAAVTAADNAPLARRGFLRLLVHDASFPADTDGDGVDDLTELGSPGTHNPLNPAPPIAPEDGAALVADRTAFEGLSHRDNFPGALDVREVKFVIFGVDTDSPELYFVDSQTHAYHSAFAIGIGRYPSNSAFTRDTYFTNSGRKNLAGSIVAHDNYIDPAGRQGIYTLEFWPTDPVAFRFVEMAYAMIAAGMPFLDGDIAYRPAGETQRALYEAESAEFAATNIRAIFAEELFANITYSALNPGETYGRLKIPTGAEPLTARDVVILRTIPNDLTHVAGIISEAQQTPLSHINLKARQNGTPNAFVSGATTHPELAPLVGQNVYFKVGPDGFEIRPASGAEVDAHFDAIRPPTTQIPVRDLGEMEIKALADLGFGDAAAFGSKAANLAELRKILPDVTPDGFAVPFHFYHQFMVHNGFYAEAQTMMDSVLFQTLPAVREAALENFRKRIRDDGTLPTWMSTALGDMQASFPPAGPVRFRSSTNSEDLEGFNGAGLYDSYTHHPDEGHFEKTAKQVWAGLWTYRAYEEREFWRIDHMGAAMGILVHPNFSGELANGVGVTTNPYIPGPGWDGHYINVQVGENLITNPLPGSVPEEFTITNLTFDSALEIQYIRRSNLIPPGQTVLERGQAITLSGHMQTLHNHFRTLYSGGAGFAMEIEFKVTSSGNLAIKQARPWIN